MSNTEQTTNKPPRMRGPMGGGPHGGHGPAEKAKDVKGTTKKLANRLSEYKIAIIIVMIFAIGSTIFSIVGPKILGNATTEIYTGLMNKINGTGGIDFAKIGKIILFALGLYAVSALFSMIQSYIMAGVAQKTTYKIRNELTEKINKLPMKYFDKRTNGEVLSIISNDVDTLSTGLNQSITQIITSIFTIIGILVMMLSISWEMTLVSLLILPISAVILKKVIGKSQKYFVKQQEYLGHVNGQVEEVYGGHNIVKVFGRENEAIKEFEKDNQELYKSGWRSQFLSGLMYPLMNFVGNVGYVAVAILGGYFAVKGRITVGNIQSFIQYNKQFTQPIGQVAQISSTIQSMLAAAERIFEFLEEKEEVEDVKKPLSTDGLKGNIKFEHVHFGYDQEKTIINDFNADVKDGQKIAIVGPTGAGKTTMVNLLMKFYDINSGDIRIDGVSTKELSRENIHSLFTMVLQDTWLFEGTVKENIIYNQKNVSDERVKEVCKEVGLDHFIRTLPKGYDSYLSENDSVSAGQRQLLTIARGMIQDSPFLILDEATSNVDTRTEELVQVAMDKLTEGRTSFIIAHRLSTIKNADLILVMKDGNIVEQGNHEQLMAKNGAYAELYNSQFEL